MKITLFFCSIIILISACTVNSSTPSLYDATPADSTIFDLNTLSEIDFDLPYFEQEIQLQISEEESFSIILYDSVFHNENFHSIPSSFFRENSTYYWRIRGRSSAKEEIFISSYRWSNWSESYCFFIQ